MKDPSAAGGQARRLGSGKPGDDKLPFPMKIHDDVAPRDWGAMMLAPDKFPQDEAWHWHLVGTAPLTGHCGLWSNVYIWLPIGWGAVPPPSNGMEVWVSLKFTGLTDLKGSGLPDQVLIDQVIAVPPLAERK